MLFSFASCRVRIWTEAEPAAVCHAHECRIPGICVCCKKLSHSSPPCLRYALVRMPLYHDPLPARMQRPNPPVWRRTSVMASRTLRHRTSRFSSTWITSRMGRSKTCTQSVYDIQSSPHDSGFGIRSGRRNAGFSSVAQGRAGLIYDAGSEVRENSQ